MPLGKLIITVFCWFDDVIARIKLCRHGFPPIERQ